MEGLVVFCVLPNSDLSLLSTNEYTFVTKHNTKHNTKQNKFLIIKMSAISEEALEISKLNDSKLVEESR